MDCFGNSTNYGSNAMKQSINTHISFIIEKDLYGSKKLVKFFHPLDLRTVEEKMSRYPFKR